MLGHESVFKVANFICRGQSQFGRPLSTDLAEWNPFDDNFGNETEDMVFGAEFDKIRRGSNTSKFHNCNIYSRSPSFCYMLDDEHQYMLHIASLGNG